jgi:hypothetical protein
MADALKFVQPVVLLDAAHLRSEYKGTLYIDVFPVRSHDIFQE